MSIQRGRRGRLTRVRLLRRRLSRRPHLWKLITGGLVAYVAVFATWAVAPNDIDPQSQAIIGDFAFLLPGLIVASLAWRAGSAPGLPRPARRAWAWLSVAYLAFWLGDVLFFVYEVVIGDLPNPSLADAAYLAYYPLLLVGLASFPRVLATGTQRLRFVLDATTVALGGSMVVWYFVLGPIAEATEPDLGALLVSMAYPVGDLVLLLGVAITLTRVPRELSRAALGLLVGGLLLSLAADLAYSVQSLEGTYESGRWVDALYLVAWALLGLSAFAGYARRIPSVEPSWNQASRDQVPLVPYLSVALGYGMLVAALRSEWTPTIAGLVVGAGGLTALVVVRQVIAVRENVGLVTEREARRGEARFRSLVQNASDLILVVDRDWTIQYETPSVERVLGYRLEELQRTRLAEIIHPDDRASLNALREQPTASANRAHNELRITRSDGSWMFVEASVTSLLDDPEIRGLVVTIRNVDDRKRLELKLTHQAYHDPLTSLANRRLFNEEVTSALAQCRDGGGPVAMLFLDVDNLKRVNDSFGHEAGDIVLVEFARRIRESTRMGDLVARISGDEFAVLLERPGSEGAAVAITERILNGLRAPFTVEGVEVILDASIGIALSSQGKEAGEDLLRNADSAMYTAKTGGKGRYVVFTPGMQAPARERLDVEAALRHSLERDEFELHYQPIVGLRDRAVVGAEALLRWHRPDNGLVNPAEFIPILEETGLIVPVGVWVLEEACRTAAAWAHDGSAAKGPSVSVNLSARQLQDPDLVACVGDILGRTGLEPARLVLEITESLLIRDPAETVLRLQALKGLGISLAIDDFGTGYSSLSYLRTLPFDELKIDRSFVADLDRATGLALVQGIVSLGHSLGMTIVAEGIERRTHAEALSAVGCEHGQGYLFARPMPARDFATFVHSHSPVGALVARGAKPDLRHAAEA